MFLWLSHIHKTSFPLRHIYLIHTLLWIGHWPTPASLLKLFLKGVITFPALGSELICQIGQYRKANCLNAKKSSEKKVILHCLDPGAVQGLPSRNWKVNLNLKPEVFVMCVVRLNECSNFLWDPAVTALTQSLL